MEKANFFLRKKLLLVISLNLLLSLLLTYLMAYSNFFFIEQIEKEVTNFGIHIRGTIVPKHVVIVAIDDKSLASLGRWPWPRKTMASLIEQISLQKPSAIAVNMLFAKGASSNSDDLALQDAVAKTDRIVLLSPLDDTKFHNLFSGKNEISGLTLHKFGHPLLVRDEKGMEVGISLRPSNSMHNEKLFPFALATAMEADSSTTYPTSGISDVIMLTNFLGPSKTVQHVSAIDVLQKSSQIDLAGKVVLIGGDAEGLTSYETTPFGRISNTEMQANIVENILQHDSLITNFITSVAVPSVFGMIFFALLFQGGKVIWCIITILMYFSLGYLAFVFCSLLFPIIPFVLILGLNIWMCKIVKRKIV
jgi:CHASE2 domain-containing sensor protein